MSYTITISGQPQQAEGQSPDQAHDDVTAKAKAFVATLPGVSAAFIQTGTGMTDLNPPAAPAAATEPTAQTEGTPSV